MDFDRVGLGVAVDRIDAVARIHQVPVAVHGAAGEQRGGQADKTVE